MKDPSALPLVPENITIPHFEDLFTDSILESGIRIFVLLIFVLVLFRILKTVHNWLARLPLYRRSYLRHQRWVEFTLILTLILFLIGEAMQLHWALIVSLGGIGVISFGIGCQDLVKNIIAYPVVRRTLAANIGHEVELIKHRGKLTKFGFTHIHLLGPYGETLTIPNRKLLTETFLCNVDSNTIYHFECEFPIPVIYHDLMSQLLNFCHETVLLSAYRSLEQPPEVGIELKDGEIWLKCVCYTNRKNYIAAYRTFFLTELVEKTYFFQPENAQGGSIKLLKDLPSCRKSISSHPNEYQYEENEHSLLSDLAEPESAGRSNRAVDLSQQRPEKIDAPPLEADLSPETGVSKKTDQTIEK
ncbi:MAG: mechanosensitive ion channel [SAR324 cluster bacterium]|nr:mechanosensitive ion channel [SAR324 cluster bacterium]